MKSLEIFTDGACSGNPGAAGIGVVIKENGVRVKEIAAPIGEATNNIAEYAALVVGLQEALLLKAHEVKVFTDSELMWSQLTGRYKVKNPKIKFFFDQVNQLKRGFESFSIQHIPREQNKEADRLASGSLKSKGSQAAGESAVLNKNLFFGQTEMVASLFDNDGEESPSSAG